MANDPLNTGQDSRRELYDRFREELAHDRRAIFFDEDDLVEIYDYASDLHDRYTSLEVLFCGDRLYPSSRALAERKALFYFALDDETATTALDMLPDDSMIKTLTALRLAHTLPDEAAPELDRLLATRKELTDEEIIQLCDTAEELGMYDWLLANRAAIASHTDYQPTFLYELCQIFQGRDPEVSLGILEELTMMEPFSIDFWLLAAQIHLEQGSYDKALAPVEYALAIDPANARALMMKAQAYHELNYPPEQTEGVIREVMASSPDHPSPYLALAMLMGHTGKSAEGLAMLRDYNLLHPGNPQTLDAMLLLADTVPDDPLADLDDFLTPAMRDYADNFIDMARRHADEGRHRPAARLLMAIDRVYRLGPDFDMMMEELYRAGLYREAVASYQEHFKADKTVVQITIEGLNDCFAAFWFILAALRTGVTGELGTLVRALLASEPVNSSSRSIDEIFESRGLAEYLLRINSYLTGTDSLSIDDLDPFADVASSPKPQPDPTAE